MIHGRNGEYLPQQEEFALTRITGRELCDVAVAKKSSAGGLDEWAWNETKALPPS